MRAARVAAAAASGMVSCTPCPACPAHSTPAPQTATVESRGLPCIATLAGRGTGVDEGVDAYSFSQFLSIEGQRDGVDVHLDVTCHYSAERDTDGGGTIEIACDVAGGPARASGPIGREGISLTLPDGDATLLCGPGARIDAR